ncbi:V/A-type H+-transporting ATPase subunit A [Clostridium tetanomorphum]|uniref:V-type ATP synthase subunit A n=1 Tax=Clostridium tetanomorphum TaxID=1553 RepID=UPI00054D0118|nr:V-type ATP synthase subunit A [Clostridium tetanomorphum]NRS85885.1 V/A-type H+-transporting ATPase subunit A [Clostridium tetanomorphum]SQB89896.1 V-type ATP synthase subunit A [Clostridium tetanomorphum]
MLESIGIIVGINGPVVKGTGMANFKMREMVMVGEKKLIGEIIILEGDIATIQVYEETSGIKVGEKIFSTGMPLSVKLGPGIIGNIFDGIERPLQKMNDIYYGFIQEGIGLISIDSNKKWDVELIVKEGDKLRSGDVYAKIQETLLITHKIMVPPNINGEVIWVNKNGKYSIEDTVVKLKNSEEIYELKLYQMWPVRNPRPIKERKRLSTPLITGQRILDSFFPIAKGGTVAIPGGFGTGKTMTQHQLAKWSDADIIIYIGCGERGNEMTEVLEDFPKLIDPKTNTSLMNRTVLIANTSNMPVAAREASIYTGITIAEYFRDMGYHVAIMADSTSRWAEALREISGRLEEMPAEEGYPAYLPSRIAEFYERAGYTENLNGTEGSVTVIGAVSPAGGDFSEPVTQNTKRFVSAFLSLDRKLAYSRHYPAINWLTSYSGYIPMLTDWYEENISPEMLQLRGKMLRILFEENKLQEIVKLVGEDVLPDNQRLILEVAKILKVGFLQQNAYHKDDTYVPIEKQYKMLKVIEVLYKKAYSCVKNGVPISQVKDKEIFQNLYKMKYNIPNEDLSGIDKLEEEIINFYEKLMSKYKER